MAQSTRLTLLISALVFVIGFGVYSRITAPVVAVDTVGAAQRAAKKSAKDKINLILINAAPPVADDTGHEIWDEYYAELKSCADKLTGNEREIVAAVSRKVQGVSFVYEIYKNRQWEEERKPLKESYLAAIEALKTAADALRD